MPITCLSHHCFEQLNVLRKSPVFAMSRGGKELFHANFISFVLELSPDQVPDQDWPKIGDVQDRLKTLLFDGNAPNKVVTWRERSSLDLIVMAAPTTMQAQSELLATAAFTGASEQQVLRCSELRTASPPVPTCAAVVVEAKLKALPRRDQLVSYNKKLINRLTLEMESPVIVDSPTDDVDGNGNNEKIWGRTTLRVLDRTGVGGWAQFFAYDVKLEGRDNSHEAESFEDLKQKATSTSPSRVATPFARLDALIRRVLLSPVDAHAVSAVVEDTGWTHLSFNDLIAVFPKQEHTGGLMVQLLTDYARSTGALLHILNAASSAAECFCRENQHSLNDLWKELKRSEFQHLRIHDAVRKFAYDSLRRSLVDHCRTSAHRLLVDIPLPDHTSNFKFFADTFMSRAQPAMNFEFTAQNSGARGRSVSIGVQVQGTLYRHFIRVSHPIALDGTGLSALARLLGDPTQLTDSSQRWWRVELGDHIVLRGAANDDFKPFGKEAFLYTDAQVATMNYQKLLSVLENSLKAARKQINDSPEFRAAVIKFLQRA